MEIHQKAGDVTGSADHNDSDDDTSSNAGRANNAVAADDILFNSPMIITPGNDFYYYVQIDDLSAIAVVHRQWAINVEESGGANSSRPILLVPSVAVWLCIERQEDYTHI